MKNLRYIGIAALCLTLVGCSRETVNSDVNSTVETAEDTDIADETKQGNDLTAESDAENPAPEEEEASRNENALSGEGNKEDMIENAVGKYGRKRDFILHKYRAKKIVIL